MTYEMDIRFAQQALISFAMSALLTSIFVASAPDDTSAAGAGPQPQAIVLAASGH
jgi:hypothetical protein